MKINNIDIAGICDRLATYSNALINSQSAFNVDYLLEEDKEKCAWYFDRLETLISMISANAPMDLPKTNGAGNHALKDFPADEVLENVENQDLRDILRRFRVMWVDLSYCRSADLSSGLNQHDLQIFNNLLQNCRQILNLSIIDNSVNNANSGTTINSNMPVI